MDAIFAFCVLQFIFLSITLLGIPYVCIKQEAPYYTKTGNQSTPITVISTRTGETLYRGYFNFANQSAYTVSVVSESLPCTNNNSIIMTNLLLCRFYR